MKICHITSAHSRYDARILGRQCNTLADNGFDVVLVCCDGKPDEIRNKINIISFSDHKLTKKERFKLLVCNSKFIKFLLSLNADIYQFHDIELIEIGRLLKRRNKKVIFDSHENWLGYISSSLPNSFIMQFLFKFLFVGYYNRFLKIFDAVFSVSPNMVDDLKQFNPNTYFVSNYPSIDTNVFLSPSLSANTFVYAGTVYSISNQCNIVEALEDIDDGTCSYLVIGKIAPVLKQEMMSLDRAKRLKFINWITPDELRSKMAGCLAGIVLLDYVPICCNKEGQLGSNKIFEYMQAGLPVICTDFILWKEMIIDKYKCGICVNPKDIEEIRNAMKYLIEHKEEAKQMGENGRQAVLNEFNWEIGIPNYINIHNKIYYEC